MVPSGRRSQPRTSTVRAGSAARKVAACSSTRRRAVRSSGRTSSRVTDVTFQPRSSAISRARRPFRSMPVSMACMSGTTDLISITRSDPVAGWKARISIEPRSPRTLNETSVAVSQALEARISRTWSTSRACRRSSRRSRPSPCHSNRTSSRASRAAATRTRVWTATRSAWPRSMRQTTDLDTRAFPPSCAWVHRRRIRRARNPSPRRTTSIS